MRQQLANRIAHSAVHRPARLIVAALCVLAACVAISASRPRLDSEVLNLLPQGAPAIQALKIFNSEFRQGRELIFALQGQADVVADAEGDFLSNLRAQPWVERVLAGSPLESPDESIALHALLPQLLLNLEDVPFRAALEALTPGKLEERVARLRTDLESGSPRAQMQATADPLGVLGSAMASMAGLDDGDTQILNSGDGTLRLFPVVTNQASLDQADCKAIMSQVANFTARMRDRWTGITAPEILITGRSAYVVQIAQSMERDIRVTSAISILAVTGLFFLGFRRWIPPLATTLILSCTCLITFAAGIIIFDNLNLIAIAFCSILVGLGDDFSLLLYNRYLKARDDAEEHEQAVATSIRDMGPGILWVGITTGAGFLVLRFSESRGFAQLGTLIALGVSLCAVLMIGFLFVFIRSGCAYITRPDPLDGMFERLSKWLVRTPMYYRLLMVVLAIGAIVVAVLPNPPLEFDSSPRSLEPREIPAAIALRTIQERLPATSETLALIFEASDPRTAHRYATALETKLRDLASRGVIESYSSPAALVLSPERLSRHRMLLRERINIEASRAAFAKALENAGFDPHAFRAAFTFFEQLSKAAQSEALGMVLEGVLPRSSAWWFLVDRYLSTRPFLTSAYVRMARPPETLQSQIAFEEALRASGVPVRVTGWRYAMVGILPWAQRELFTFGGMVTALILACLAVAYRRLAPLLVHFASLAFGLGICVAMLKATGTSLNMLNALALPLILGVGVDYGMHLLLALKNRPRTRAHLPTVLKPVVISGLTTITGFGALVFAQNPALKGLGVVCGLGVASCLISSVFFAVPLMMWVEKPSGS